MAKLLPDTNKGYLQHIDELAQNDAKGLHESDKKYSDSWKRRGGVGAFMMLARKWDRIENDMKNQDKPYDIFYALEQDQRKEGLVDDIRDLRRYLCLVEAEMLARGFPRSSSNLPDEKPSTPLGKLNFSEPGKIDEFEQPLKDYNADQ